MIHHPGILPGKGANDEKILEDLLNSSIVSAYDCNEKGVEYEIKDLPDLETDGGEEKQSPWKRVGKYLLGGLAVLGAGVAYPVLKGAKSFDELKEFYTDHGAFVLKHADSDNDELTDWDELNVYGTDLNKKDTDGDWTSDKKEIRQGTNPLEKDVLIFGSEEDKRAVAVLMENLKQYSPEWYEKTIVAAEKIKLGDIDGAGKSGLIILNRPSVYDAAESDDLKNILSENARFPHEVQHVIDMNVYGRWSNVHELDSLESELRAGIAEDIYKEEIDKQVPGFFRYYWSGRFNSAYESSYDYFKDSSARRRVDETKYKDRLEEIERKYFDHENKRLKTDFLDESWMQFQEFLIKE